MPIDLNLLRTDKGKWLRIHHKVLINNVGGDPEKVKKSIRDRFQDDKIVDEILDIDTRWRKRKLS